MTEKTFPDRVGSTAGGSEEMMARAVTVLRGYLLGRDSRTSSRTEVDRDPGDCEGEHSRERETRGAESSSREGRWPVAGAPDARARERRTWEQALAWRTGEPRHGDEG
jgi:hypothetical protein